MTSNLDNEDTKQEQANKDCILCFPKDISTKEALETIKQHKFKCGYKYIIEEEGQNIIRAIFYNHKYDLLSIRFTEDQFYLPTEVSRLYINRQIEVSKGVFKAKHFLPINPFNEFPHTKSVITTNVEPIDINNIDNIVNYQQRLIPDNYDIEVYRRKRVKEIKETKKNSSERSRELEKLSHVVQLANLYKFEETYKELDDTLKILYKPLLENHKSEFYSRIFALMNCTNCDDIITELLDLLGIVLDKDAILSEMTRKPENSHITNKTIIERLKSLKSIIKQISDKETVCDIMARHNEWFEQQTQTSTGPTLKLSIQKSRI